MVKKNNLFILILFIPGLVQAATNSWSSIGPYGGDIRQITFDPNNASNLYAAGNGGVFKSIDGGSNWSLNLPGLASGISIADDSSIIVAAYGSGIQVSSDNGMTWSRLNLLDIGIGSATVMNIDSSGQAVLAVNIQNELYYSTDLTTNGEKLPEFTLAANIQAVIIDPANISRLMLGTDDGIYLSTDAGVSWDATTTPSGFNSIASLTSDPNFSGTFYAATNGGVLKSSDNGNTWSDVFTSTLLDTISVDPKNSNIVYASRFNNFYQSTDAGSNWVSVNTNGAETIAIHPSINDKLFIGNGANVFVSTDSGASFLVSSAGINATSPDLLEIQPSTGKVFVGGIFGHSLYISDNNGILQAAPGGLVSSPINDIGFDPTDDDTFYTAGLGSPGGVFKTTDAGVTWSERNTGFGNHVATSVAVSKTDANFLVVGARDAANLSLANVGLSTNAAGNWIQTNDSLANSTDINHLLIDPLDDDIIYLATETAGVLKSIDSGLSWTAVNAGLPKTNSINNVDYITIQYLVFSPHNNDIYASFQKRVFHSTDAGASWTERSFLNQAEHGISLPDAVIGFHPTDASIMYIGNFQSKDEGSSWCGISTGLPAEEISKQVAINPVNPTNLFVSTGSNGVYSINLVREDPTANAGADFSHDAKDSISVLLSGSASLDSGGCIIAYEWEQISGPNVAALPEDEMETSFEASKDGVYVFELTVTDNDGDAASTQISITVFDTDPDNGGGSGGGQISPTILLVLMYLFVFRLRRRLGIP